MNRFLKWIFNTKQIEIYIKEQENELEFLKKDIKETQTFRVMIKNEVYTLKKEHMDLRTNKEISNELEMYKSFVGGRHFNKGITDE